VAIVKRGKRYGVVIYERGQRRWLGTYGSRSEAGEAEAQATLDRLAPHAMLTVEAFAATWLERYPRPKRSERASPLEPAYPAPSGQQGLLERILGVVYRREHAVAVGVQGAAVWLHQPGEGALIAGAGRLQQLVLVHAIHPHKGCRALAARRQPPRRKELATIA
jgi:hypothetical protein